MAKLNNTQVNGDLTTTEHIAENGKKIDSKYASQASISGYTITVKAPDGTTIQTFTLPS